MEKRPPTPAEIQRLRNAIRGATREWAELLASCDHEDTPEELQALLQGAYG